MRPTMSGPSGCPVHVPPRAFTRVLCVYHIRWMNLTIAVAERGTLKSGHDVNCMWTTERVFPVLRFLNWSKVSSFRREVIYFKVTVLDDLFRTERPVLIALATAIFHAESCHRYYHNLLLLQIVPQTSKHVFCRGSWEAMKAFFCL